MGSPDQELLDLLADAAATLSPDALGWLSAWLCGAARRSDVDVASILHGTPPDARIVVEEILGRWKSSSYMSPSELAWAIRASVAAVDRSRRDQSITLVWTGPTAFGQNARRTEQALLDVIGAAWRRLLLTTYVAFDVPQIAAAMIEAARRHVAIDLVLETPDSSQGRMSLDGLRALGEDVRRVSTVYFWPAERRPRDQHGHAGSLHAKAAVADSRLALLTSANLTGFALSLNIELGVLICGGDIPFGIVSEFDALISRGDLVPIP